MIFLIDPIQSLLLEIFTGFLVKKPSPSYEPGWQKVQITFLIFQINDWTLNKTSVAFDPTLLHSVITHYRHRDHFFTLVDVRTNQATKIGRKQSVISSLNTEAPKSLEIFILPSKIWGNFDTLILRTLWQFLSSAYVVSPGPTSRKFFFFFFVFAKLSQAKPQLQLSWLALASLNFT